MTVVRDDQQLRLDIRAIRLALERIAVAVEALVAQQQAGEWVEVRTLSDAVATRYPLYTEPDFTDADDEEDERA